MPNMLIWVHMGQESRKDAFETLDWAEKSVSFSWFKVPHTVEVLQEGSIAKFKVWRKDQPKTEANLLGVYKFHQAVVWKEITHL